VYKLDWALREPIPWRHQDCARAATVHIGGTLDELVTSEGAPWRGDTAVRPFVLLVQPTLFDPSRAPPGRHIAWAYAHVPNGSTTDMTDAIERQIERFAPGFRETVLARSVLTPARLETFNPNLIGGDLGGGANTLRQILFRPVPRRIPYETGIPNVYLCSSSTPPGGGVHGMCGYHAARAALKAAGGRTAKMPSLQVEALAGTSWPIAALPGD
jgi:phytoene dehydrogenase-like protein